MLNNEQQKKALLEVNKLIREAIDKPHLLNHYILELANGLVSVVLGILEIDTFLKMVDYGSVVYYKDLLTKLDFKDMPIEDLDISVRLFNVLKSLKMNTLFDLSNITKEYCLEKRMGQSSINELEAILAQKGIKIS